LFQLHPLMKEMKKRTTGLAIIFNARDGGAQYGLVVVTLSPPLRSASIVAS
jgi:hypothetical protein